MPYFVMTLISNGEARKYMLKIQENLFNCFELFERFQKKMVFSLYQSFVRPLSLSKSLRSFAMTRFATSKFSNKKFFEHKLPILSKLLLIKFLQIDYFYDINRRLKKH